MPPRFGVIGGGPIGCELAQAFARLGSRVTLFHNSGHVLPREDPDAAAIVQKALSDDGVQLHLDVRLTGIQRDGVQRDGGPTTLFFETSDGRDERLEVDALLVAAGRVPNVDGLGLEAAGVVYDNVGVRVDDKLRTTNTKIFACGDVASRFKFTHAADAQARTVIRNAFFFGRGKASRLVIPWATYTSPEVAHVGLTAEEARKSNVDTITIDLDDVDRARLDGEDDGFLRVYLKKGTDKILGATLVAAHAGDMIGALSLAMTHGLGLSKFSSTIFPYPTQGEIFRKAGDAYNRTKLTPRAKAFFGAWFKLFQ